MVMGPLSGKIEGSMSETISTISKKGKEDFSGEMEGFMKENGKEDLCMGMENLLINMEQL